MNKLLPTEVSVIINRAIDATNDYHDSYAFAAGYLGSMMAGLIADLPKHKQREAVQNLQNLTSKFNAMNASK